MTIPSVEKTAHSAAYQIGRQRRDALLRLCFAAGLFCSSIGARAFSATPASDRPFRGNVPVREYSFEEIGPVYGGLRFGSDPFGRLIVTRESAHLVYDGATWTEILVGKGFNPNLVCTAHGSDGRVYCAGAGFWGVLDYTSSRAASVRSFRPDTVPGWIANDVFFQIVPARDGTLFVGVSGCVFRWNATGEQRYFQTSGTNRGFALGDCVYMASRPNSLVELNTVSGTVTRIDSATFGGPIGTSAAWDKGHVLVAIGDSHLALFDGKNIERWPTEIDALLSSGVAAMRMLDDDRVVLAVRGHGLQFLDRHGRSILAMDEGRYPGVIDLYQNEPGVLWVSFSSGIAKILFKSPVEVFDQGMGLDVNWSDPLSHNGHLFVVSSGHAYEGLAGEPGVASRFEMLPLASSIPGGVWSGAESTEGILFGGIDGAYYRQDDGKVTKVLEGFAVTRLWMTDDSHETCLAIGREGIALLKWDGSAWREAAPRVGGLGYPSQLMSAAPNSLWIEMGVNRVGHVTVQGSSLHAEVITPFEKGSDDWANLGKIGHFIVVSRRSQGRVYFDEAAGSFCAPPPIDGVLSGAPYWTLRPQQDANGVIWAPYAHGVFRLLPTPSGYRPDTDTFQVVQDGYPVVELHGRDGVWVRSDRRLMRLDAGVRAPLEPLRPRLVGVFDSRAGIEVWSGIGRDQPRLSIPYRSNSLDFYIFSGTNAMLQDPTYQFRLDGYSGQWSEPNRSAVISLTQLHEGAYQMHVRLVRDMAPLGEPLEFPFTIRPPLYRTWYAYTLYALLFVAAVGGLVTLRVRTLHSRNRMLEGLVAARTAELTGKNQSLEKAAGTLHESEELFSRAFRDAPVLMAISDFETGHYLEVNEKCVALTGYSREEIIGRTADEVGWQRPEDRESRRRLLKENGRVSDLEITLIKKNGESLHCIYSGNLVMIAGKKRLLSISQDITARKNAEDQVATLSSALMQSPASIVITNAKGEVEYVNPAFTRASGFTLEAALGKSPQLLKGTAASVEEYRQIQSAIANGREWRGELRNQRKNGDLFWEDTLISPIRDSGGRITHFLEIDEDITRRKQMEENLQHTQKLDAIGQLTGGIAHDFNNVLAAILLNLGLLINDEGVNQKTKDVLVEMMTSAQRASSMTRQLLVFSRRSVFETKVVDLGELLASSLKMLERLIGENITLKYNREADLPLVKADPGMLEQVILNLVLNARDAMPKGGTVTVDLARVEMAGESADLDSAAPSGEYVCISVTDTGCGMNEATMKRIFEPFFTTKDSSAGTGLGLATVHGVVTRHKGKITVRSSAGEGSTFRVYFPSIKSAGPEADLGETVKLSGGNETILLVEDELSIRRVVAKCLLRWGYSVLEAEDGKGAIELWRSNRERIGLVLTDMMMPGGMNGLDLAMVMRRDMPAIKIIITSGYALDLAKENSPVGESVRFLQKPYVIDVLAKSIREYLDEN